MAQWINNSKEDKILAYKFNKYKKNQAEWVQIQIKGYLKRTLQQDINSIKQ